MLRLLVDANLDGAVGTMNSGDLQPIQGEMLVESKKVRIVDYGRGPQIEDHRLTVMDVFYYLHRGYDFDFIHRAMPTLTCEQFDAVNRVCERTSRRIGGARPPC